MAATPTAQDEVKTLGRAARGEAAALAAHVRPLDAAGWEAPSWCEGWTVREVVAHLAEGMDRFGQQVRGALSGQPVEFAQAERDARRAQVKALPVGELVVRLEGNTAAIFDFMEPLSADDLTRPVVPMAAGLTPVLQVAQLRLFEMAAHRWDVRAPTDPTATMDAQSVALLMDWVLAGAHRQAKREALQGLQGAVVCHASGAGGGPITITCRDGAVEVARGARDMADATLLLQAETLTRFLWGRVAVDRALETGSIEVEGDRELVHALGRAFGNR